MGIRTASCSAIRAKANTKHESTKKKNLKGFLRDFVPSWLHLFY
jgi:hypothetical protein